MAHSPSLLAEPIETNMRAPSVEKATSRVECPPSGKPVTIVSAGPAG